MISGVYIIRNIVSNKCYIGSSMDINYRWSMHTYDLQANRHHCIHLQRSWNKHGKDNFKFEILSTCPSEYLVKLEQWFLDNLKPEFNILPSAYSIAGYNHTNETKEKISKNLKEHFKNNPVWNKGKKLSEEHRLNMIEARKGKGTGKRSKTWSWSKESRQRASERCKKEVNNINKK